MKKFILSRINKLRSKNPKKELKVYKEHKSNDIKYSDLKYSNDTINVYKSSNKGGHKSNDVKYSDLKYSNDTINVYKSDKGEHKNKGEYKSDNFKYSDDIIRVYDPYNTIENKNKRYMLNDLIIYEFNVMNEVNKNLLQNDELSKLIETLYVLIDNLIKKKSLFYVIDDSPVLFEEIIRCVIYNFYVLVKNKKLMFSIREKLNQHEKLKYMHNILEYKPKFNGFLLYKSILITLFVIVCDNQLAHDYISQRIKFNNNEIDRIVELLYIDILKDGLDYIPCSINNTYIFQQIDNYEY